MSALAEAGTFFMHVRDQAIASLGATLEGTLKSARAQELARRCAGLSPEDKKRLVVAAVDDVLVTLLSAVDADAHADFVYRGDSIKEQSDGLAGELFGSSGWISRYSRYEPSA